MGPKLTLLLASLLFFASGALGLGYQLVWVKKSALLVGSSQIALSTVLTSFFLGLGLGSLFVGRYLRSRRWSPLLVYGLFELCIGVFALAFPLLFSAVGYGYGVLYPGFQDSPLALYFLRFALLFLLFLIPTFFMGGTLPLLLDGLVKRDESIGPLTSRLYGINILGAVAGVLATAYFAIPLLGMNGTSLLAGCGNLLIGAVAVLAFRGVRPVHTGDSPPALQRSLLFSALAFSSGLAAIGYQVIWARYFNLFREINVYFIALFLAVYLLSLAIGSLASAGLLSRGVRPLRAMALLQPWVPLLLLFFVRAWTLANYHFVRGDDFEVHANWALANETLDAILIAPIAQISLVIFVPVVVLGTGLPLLIAAATRHSDELRNSAGTLVFWNTLGSSAGGFVVGYVLIPFAGLTGAILAMGSVSIFLGAAAEWCLGRETENTAQESGAWRRYARPGYVVATLCLVGFALYLPRDFAARVIQAYGWGARAGANAKMVEMVEGPLTTAWVYRKPDNTRIGSGNVGLAEAWHTRASPQMVQGHIPMLFYPKPGVPKRALGIAVGSGQAFGALLHYPIEKMDVVDISSEMLRLSFKHFAPFNNDLGTDPRVEIHLDDGRHFVGRAPDSSYDVVTTEPPPPADEGVFALYSLEFYREVHRVLREGGVFLQWLPLYMVTPDDMRGMLHTQITAFPHTFLMRSADRDFAIVSFKGERPVFRPDWIAERARYFANERRVQGWRWSASCPYAVVEPESVMAMILAGPEAIAELGSAVLHRDDDMRLSYSSGDRELLRRYGGKSLAALSFAALPSSSFEELQSYFSEELDATQLAEQRACSLAVFGVASPSLLARKERQFDENRDPATRASIALEIAKLHARSLSLHATLEWIGRGISAHPNDGRPASLEAARRLARANAAVSGDEIRVWLDSLPPTSRDSLVAAAMRGELQAAEARAASMQDRYWLD